MNNIKKYQKAAEVQERETTEWILSTFKKHLLEADRKLDFNDYQKKYILLVSAKCSAKSVDGKDPVQSAIARFRKVYLSICDELISHHVRKRWLQPYCFAFFDHEGSRYGATYHSDPIAPHVHSTMMLHPDAVDKFDQLGAGGLQTKLKSMRMSGVTDIDVRVFDPSVGPLERWVGYSAKAYHRNFKGNAQTASEFLVIFPEPEA